MTMNDYRKLKEDIANSGMSVRQYCQEHNLKPSAVYHTFKRLKGEELSLTVIDVPDSRR